ncbi:MAG: hypothetical protein P8172_08900 [Gammaproteobacteria bacterium]
MLSATFFALIAAAWVHATDESPGLVRRDALTVTVTVTITIAAVGVVPRPPDHAGRDVRFDRQEVPSPFEPHWPAHAEGRAF